MRSLFFEGNSWSTYETLRQKDRLIYTYDNEAIYVFAIGGHYDQF